ncbi:MAG: Crp/Fnr family transcriptional regulator [Ignavibacteria bacterium]|nr:Crp/Fnr family transcriptional regulator [Ignavibacteria bacterium]MCC7159530.1 Crp/Fnr family transcriptional regulator [Ignavibacteria bacterium]
MITNVLKKVHIFSGLNKEELEKLCGIVKVKAYNKGDIIFFDTEPYFGFYITEAGLVKIYKISKDGREHILHLIAPYNTFAEVPLFENFGEEYEDVYRYPANAMALEDETRVILIPARQFRLLVESDSKICIKMISGFAKRLRHLNHHIEELTLKDVTKRTAGFILTEYNNKKKPKNRKESDSAIELNISKNDLAAYLGTINETLSRTFKKLQDEGIIEVEGKMIWIVDMDKLKEVAA